VVLGESTAEPGRPLIGITVSTHLLAYQLPAEVQVKVRDLGGPSAGLVFALGIYESLTRQDLTRGHRIAGTGALAATGQVGPVGGVTYKVRAAEKAGAGYFLVPRGNLEEARRAARRTTVVPVESFAEALDFLRGLAPAR